MNYALYLMFKEDLNTLRKLTAHNQIDVSDSFDYVIRQITDSSGIPFVTAEAEKQWQIMALRCSHIFVPLIHLRVTGSRDSGNFLK